MTILVTGASGQLGTAFRKLSAAYDEYDFIFTSRTGGEGMEALDITDAPAVMNFLKDNGIDVIINCAGYTDVNKAEIERDKAWLLNVTGPEILAEAAKGNGALLIHFSTDYVYDGKANLPYKENDDAGPLNHYAKTKLEGDMAIAASGCRYMIFRTSWMYSIYGRNFFRTIEEKASAMPSITVVMDQIGTPTYAHDLVEAVLWIVSDGQLNKIGIYNFSNEGVCSWYDFAHAINRECGYLCDVRPCFSAECQSPVLRPAYSVLDKTLFKETFRYEIPNWRDSLALCVKEFNDAQ